MKQVLTARSLIRSQLVGNLALVGLTFGGLQAVRLAGNVALSHLLAPAVFGVMLIFNTLRTGVELFSDLGIGQSVVANKSGGDPAFYGTAWTVQIVRGLGLACVVIALSPFVGWFYGDAVFLTALPIMAVLFAVGSLTSPGRFLLQRSANVRALSVFDFTAGTIAMAVQVAISFFDRTVWSLMYGAVVCTSLTVMPSFVMTPSKSLRLRFDRTSVRSIIHFGKWIFASSLIYFVASNFDRLYLSAKVPFGLLGVYGVARSLSELMTLLVNRIGGTLVFPIVARNAHNPNAMRAKASPYYVPLLLAAAVGLGLFVAVSDRLIMTLYDVRYHKAAEILPILSVGVWFSIIATLSDSMLLGLSKPSASAVGNIVRLGWLLAASPVMAAWLGFAGIVLVVAAADMVRCFALSLALKRARISFIAVDLSATAVFFFALVSFRLLGHQLGVLGPFGDLWRLVR